MCPYLEINDSRCATHQSLGRLDEAMGLCANSYETCPLYRKLLADDPAARAESPQPLLVAG